MRKTTFSDERSKRTVKESTSVSLHWISLKHRPEGSIEKLSQKKILKKQTKNSNTTIHTTTIKTAVHSLPVLRIDLFTRFVSTEHSSLGSNNKGPSTRPDNTRNRRIFS